MNQLFFCTCRQVLIRVTLVIAAIIASGWGGSVAAAETQNLIDETSREITSPALMQRSTPVLTRRIHRNVPPTDTLPTPPTTIDNQVLSVKPVSPVPPLKRASAEGDQITLAELGLLQLAAHDLFNVDRETELDSENGRFDLSTLLEYGEENIARGGEPRNRENIFIASVAAQYGGDYLALQARGFSTDQAYERMLRKYHSALRAAYVKIFNESVPEPSADSVTATENLALRTIHDFLPGTVTVGGVMHMTVAEALRGQLMTDDELQALSAPLDGEIDPVFLDVEIFIPPDQFMQISLLERDSSFGEQFGTEHSFTHFMAELADGSYDRDEDVMHYIRTLFAKGFYRE